MCAAMHLTPSESYLRPNLYIHTTTYTDVQIQCNTTNNTNSYWNSYWNVLIHYSNHAWVSYSGFTESYNDATENGRSGIYV